MNLIEKRILKTLKRQSGLIKSINFIEQTIDFFDIFPKNEEDKKILEKEASNYAITLKKSPRGNFYKFITPIQTPFGDLYFFKIRWFDNSKVLFDGAADFVITDFDKFKKTYSQNNFFEPITNNSKTGYDGYKYQDKNNWICFLNSSIKTVLK